MLIDGKAVAADVKEFLKRNIEDYRPLIGRAPKLLVLMVGDDPASATYVKNKEKACKAVGIETQTLHYTPTDINLGKTDQTLLYSHSLEGMLIDAIDRANRDNTIDGILVQLPLPQELDTKKILNHIDPRKDVDGFTSTCKGNLYNGIFSYIPCTPAGIIKLLDKYNISVSGKNVVIVGRSNIVGQPLAKLMLDLDGTVTICHSKTQNLAEITKTADILVAAVGKPKMITADMVKDGAVVIDVGINRIDGKLCGDVDFDNVEPKASYITPVPGGVGPMTIAMLLDNTFRAYVMNNLR